MRTDDNFIENIAQFYYFVLGWKGEIWLFY